MNDTASTFRVWVPDNGTSKICAQLRETLQREVPDCLDFMADLAWRGGTAARKVIVLSAEEGQHEMLMFGPDDLAALERANGKPALANVAATENLVRVLDIVELYDTDTEIPVVIKAGELHAIHLVQLP